MGKGGKRVGGNERGRDVLGGGGGQGKGGKGGD